MKKLLAGILILIVVIASLLYWAAYTTSGLRAIVKYSSPFIPGKLVIKQVDGSLLDEIKLRDISYKSEQQAIRIEKLDLQWSAGSISKLISGEIIITKFIINGIEYINNKQQHISNGVLIANGKLNKYEFTFTGDLHLPQHSKLQHIKLTGSGSMQKIHVSQFITNYKNSKLSASGGLAWKPQTKWDIDWQASDLNLQNWTKDISGIINAKGNVRGKLTKQIENRISIDQATGTIQKQAFSAHAVFQQQGNNWWFDKSHITIGKNSLHIQGGIAPKWDLQFKLNIPDISFISAQQTGSAELEGKFQLIKRGKLRRPAPQFVVSGQTNLPEYFSKPTKLNLTATQKNNNQWNYTGDINNEKGNLAIAGDIEFTKKHPNVAVNVSGKNFQLLDTHEYKVTINPNLKLTYKHSKLHINGAVEIPEALIAPTDLSSTIGLPPDVVFTDIKQEKKAEKLPIISKVKIKLGNKVQVKIMGIDAWVTGAVEVHEAPGQPTTGSGVLTITKGSYEKYGRSLKITNGKLIFTGGNIGNPGLDITAIQQVTETKTQGSVMNTLQGLGLPVKASKPTYTTSQLTVGIRVSGTVHQPKISLFSSPANMSQADILSMLVIGKKTSALTGGESKQLAQSLALLNVGGSQATQILGQLQHSVGLDQLGIESESYIDSDTKAIGQTPAIVLGKALSPRLFISYSIGVIHKAQIFRARYSINKNLTLQGETQSDRSSVDLLYHFERK